MNTVFILGTETDGHKQCSPWSDATKCCIKSGSMLSTTLQQLLDVSTGSRTDLLYTEDKYGKD